MAKKTAKRTATKRTSKPAAKTAAPKVRPMNARLAKMTAEPVKTEKAAKPAPKFSCLCGCGQPTKRDWAQGHDAKAKSQLMVKLGSGFGAALAAADGGGNLSRQSGHTCGPESPPPNKPGA